MPERAPEPDAFVERGARLALEATKPLPSLLGSAVAVAMNEFFRVDSITSTVLGAYAAQALEVLRAKRERRATEFADELARQCSENPPDALERPEDVVAATRETFEQLDRAMSDRAVEPLARLLMSVVHGERRDRFVRGAGRLFTEADDVEWDALEALIGVIGGPIDGRWGPRDGEQYRDHEHELGGLYLDVQVGDRMRVIGARRSGGPMLEPFEIADSPNGSPLFRLLVRHGLAEPYSTNAFGAEPLQVIIDRETAVRLHALIDE